MQRKNELRSQLLKYLKALHLPAITECFEEAALRAQSETLSYEMYLLEVIEREYEVRYNNRIHRNLKESHLPLEKNLNSFDLAILPHKVQHQVNTLMRGSFLDGHENILVFGNPGSGKTHLVCAIGQELIQKGWRVYFSTCSLLVQELLIAKRELRLARKMKQLSKFNAIIIDDIGYVQQEPQEMEVLFSLLAERYERGSLITTRNPSIFKMGKDF